VLDFRSFWVPFITLEGEIWEEVLGKTVQPGPMKGEGYILQNESEIQFQIVGKTY
jgi:hypothetical protein